VKYSLVNLGHFRVQFSLTIDTKGIPCNEVLFWPCCCGSREFPEDSACVSPGGIGLGSEKELLEIIRATLIEMNRWEGYLK
jgi:hypothetical protein